MGRAVRAERAERVMLLIDVWSTKGYLLKIWAEPRAQSAESRERLLVTQLITAAIFRRFHLPLRNLVSHALPSTMQTASVLPAKSRGRRLLQ